MKPAMIPLLGAMLLSACATTGRMSDADKLALYRSHAGPPQSSMQYFGHVDGWTPLGDQAVAVWVHPREAYLLELYGPCSDIEYTSFISITSQGGRVYPRFDKVIAHNRGAIEIPCNIQEIRKLDVSAIRRAEKTARDEAQASGSGT